MSHNQHENDNDHSHGTGKGIGTVSIINLILGSTEYTAGVLARSETLKMQGLHDLNDGLLYFGEKRAAIEPNPKRRKIKSKIGALALGLSSIAFGAYELSNSHTSEVVNNIAIPMALGGLAINSGAAIYLIKCKEDESTKPSIRHVLKVDLPASIYTAIATPFIHSHPALDKIGVGVHMGFATYIAAHNYIEASKSN